MCLLPNYRFQSVNDSDDEPPKTDAGQMEYDPCKPNDFEQMLIRKRRIEKQLKTLMNVRQKQAIVDDSGGVGLDLNATADDVFN